MYIGINPILLERIKPTIPYFVAAIYLGFHITYGKSHAIYISHVFLPEENPSR